MDRDEGLTFEDADPAHPVHSEALERLMLLIAKRRPESLPPGVVYAWYCPVCNRRLAAQYRSDVLQMKLAHLQLHRRRTPLRARVVDRVGTLRSRLSGR